MERHFIKKRFKLVRIIKRKELMEDSILMKKKCLLWMNVVLVFALIAGLAFPVVNVNAAGKSKKKKVLVVYFSATGTTKSAAKKIIRRQGGNCMKLKQLFRIPKQI